MDKFKYNLDFIIYENNELKLYGWLCSKDHNIEDIKIRLSSIHNNVIYFDPEINIKREDVESALKFESALFSGFEFNKKIATTNNFDVKLEFKIDNKEYSILLKTIIIDSKDRIGGILNKINLINIKKSIKAVLRGEFWKIKKAIYSDVIEFKFDEELAGFVDLEILNENASENVYSKEVDIIIPIYNGFEYLDILFKTICNTNIKHNVFIVDDCSPDDRVIKLLENILKENKNYILIKNDMNLGFVKSVNKALRLTTNDVVLLNTDIEVPSNWLERLVRPMLLDNKIASVTPFSNSATLCSFPNIGEDNEIFLGLSCNDIDDAFKEIQPQYNELPTGVGFCMALSRQAIDEVGVFDEETFAKGYGEENDWCQRAIKKGFKNVIAENLFVYHKHGGSFNSEEKQKLISENYKLLIKKHKKYDSDVANFFKSDKLKMFRDYAIIKLYSRIEKTIVIFDHNIGGGASKYINDYLFEENPKSYIIARYDNLKKYYVIEFNYNEIKFKYKVFDFKQINEILNIIDIKFIMINELVTYNDLYDIIHNIIDIKQKFDVEITFLAHDYYAICPSYNLIDNEGLFCNIPEDIRICNKCLLSNDFNAYTKYESIEKWRNNWESLLEISDNIVFFSDSSKHLFSKLYNLENRYKVIPHKLNHIRKVSIKNKQISSTINIAIIGSIGYVKGSEKVREAVELIQKKDLNVNIKVIGIINENIKLPKFEELGKYNQADLPDIIEKNSIDIVWISSICPETFSYTTQEAIAMGLPVAVFNLGAPAERVKSYNKGLIISKIDSEVAISEIIDFVENEIRKNKI